MRIGIDARILKYKEYRGIASSTFFIIKALSEQQNDDISFFLISNCEIHLPVELPDNWHRHVEGIEKNGVLWTVLELPLIIKKLKIDVFWGPNFLLPPRVKECKYILTVHDLAIFMFKGIASRKTYLILKIFGKLSCNHASKIIAVSETTKKDIVRLYKIPESKISVCYNGVDAEYLNIIIPKKPNINEILNKDFFLFMSTIEPRKNPITVLEAYEVYRDNDYGDEKLIFIGAEGWNLKKFKESLARNKYKKDIIFTGYISETEKKWLLQNAVSLIYPSLYEGFGLPILEAFSIETPVITSNVSAMPEVGEDACIYVDNPNDKYDLAKKMLIVKNLNEQEYELLKKKMKKQIKKYSWNTSADQLMKIIREL